MTISESKQRLVQFLVLVAVLLIAFYVRLQVITERSFDSDEVRLVSRAEGTFAQVIAWQPTDWPPLFNLVVSAWLHNISDVPMFLRLLAVFWAMFSLATTYRLAHDYFGGFPAGLSAMLALAALRYHIEFSGYLRGYIMAMALFPLTLWLSLRYFDNPRWQRALPLAVSIATMFYTTYISMFAFLIIGIVTLFRHGRDIWRWWMPVLMSFVFVLPELIYKYSQLSNRFTTTESANIQQFNSLSGGINYLIEYTFGTWFTLWFGLIILAGIVLLIRQRRTIAWVFLTVAVIAPFFLWYAVEAKIIFHFHHRYIWWVMPGIALFISAGVAKMPVLLRLPYLAILFAFMFINLQDYRANSGEFYDYETNFGWLAEQIQAGDVLIRDSRFCFTGCGHGAMKWHYYANRYLGHKIAFVNNPADYRRIWYVRNGVRQNEDLEDLIYTDRIGAEFIGPTYFFVHLVIAPPDPEGILYDNGIRFHGIDFLDDERKMQRNVVQVKEQKDLRVRLWWSVDEPLSQDYSISIQLLDEQGQLISQHDGAPQPIHLQPFHPEILPQSITEWEAGRIYVEERTLSIPELDNFHYASAVIIVYDWRDNTRFSAEGVDENGILTIERDIFISGW